MEIRLVNIRKSFGEKNVRVEMYYEDGLKDWKVQWLKSADSDSFGYVRHCIV